MNHLDRSAYVGGSKSAAAKIAGVAVCIVAGADINSFFVSTFTFSRSK